MKEIEVAPGRLLRSGEWRRISSKMKRTGTARLLVFEDGEVRYHDESDMLVTELSQAALERFLKPSETSTLQRIAPAPKRRADGR